MNASLGSLWNYGMKGVWTRGVVILILLGLPVYAWFAPLLTPWEDQPSILQPARVQSAWLYIWFTLTWFFIYQSAALSARIFREGHFARLHVSRHSKTGMLLQTAITPLFWFLLSLLIAASLAAWWSPSDAEEAKGWRILILQETLLIALVAAPLFCLVAALATRMSEAVASLIGMILLGIGLFGMDWVAPALQGKLSGVASVLWVFLPRYDLADLTSRFIFKMGPLSTSSFGIFSGILIAQALALCFLALCIFRTHSR